MLVQVNDIEKSFGLESVLKLVNIQFDEGRTHVLIGESGSGKSTLLKIILGLIKPDRGSVQVGDMNVTPRTQRDVALKTGYVIQDGGLYPHLTAYRNVALAVSLRGWSKQKVKERILELAELVGLSDVLLEKFPRDLSGGQKQRVGLMRALMTDPRLLVLDEPLGSLDPLVRVQLQDKFKDIFRSLKKTVIMVTHDLNEAAKLGETISLLKNGEIIQTGPFSELIKSPANNFVSDFIQSQKPSDLWQ